MTEPKPTPPADNYDELDAPALRLLLRQKQAVVVQVISENQTAVTMRLRAESAQRDAERKTEAMEVKVRNMERAFLEAAKQRDSAVLFATTMYEKFVYLSGLNKKAKDVKKVVQLLHYAMEEVSRITMWPELDEMDLLNKIFAAAERRVFGSAGKKSPVTDPSAFVERSLQKKKNGREQEHGTEDPHQG